MLNTTLERINCPRRKRGNKACEGSFRLITKKKWGENAQSSVFEVLYGSLKCLKCHAVFPILAGVALLVDDVQNFLMNHVKGISQVVPDSEIPSEFRRNYLAAKADIQTEHIEEDLEAERVTALYLMNHYLRIKDSTESNLLWWKPRQGPGSPLMDSLIREYWDNGPFTQIKRWVSQISQNQTLGDVVELGCGVGGLFSVIKGYLKSYLGVDSSFASIALARHLSLGVPYRQPLKIPEDLLQGPVSRVIKIPLANHFDGNADFIVGDLESLPLTKNVWNIAIALNAIDMLDNPGILPELKFDLLKNGGTAIQSCPYIWHEGVARKLRKILPKEIQDSARAAEWLYEKSGFKIEERIDHLPWLFFKHVRQMEIYSVHLFRAKKN